MSKMFWADFQGDSETAVVVREIEIEIDLLRHRKEQQMKEGGNNLTDREQGWYDALFWVRAKLEDVEGNK